MALQTITSTVQTTCHYVFTPQAIQDITGLGVELPASGRVTGWTNADAVSVPSSLSVQLDDTFLWDVNITFQLAPPVIFEGFSPAGGGDLLTMLAAQGWTAL